ncbi:MAG: hypothetical protein EAX96_02215 [Candidatus Lokiarchaeota archaeon]|nr:hypothetical protein [Candidatus Lokiarchaeota archaeon]
MVPQSLKKENFRKYIMIYILIDTSMRIDGMTRIKLENLDLNQRNIYTKGKIDDIKYIFRRNLKKEIETYLMIRKRINSVHNNNIPLFFSHKSI